MHEEPLARPVSTPLTAWLFRGVTAVAVAALLAPPVLLACTPPFPGRVAGVLLFTAAWGERMWAMYLRRSCAAAGRDWSALAIGYSFTLIMGGAIVEFLLRRRGFGHGGRAAAGAAVYAVALAVRYWAFVSLGPQWHVDVSDPGHGRRLVRTGPYRFVRHPIYLGSCLEAVGLPWLLGAWVALALGVCVFAPLELARARYEERFLRGVFGEAYAQYADEVPGFLPRRRRRRKSGG